MSFFKTLIFFIFFVSFFSMPVLSQESWRETSFEDFVDGTFDDAGANMYVSHKGRIQTVNRWDVNSDGNVDILCANSHPLVEMLDMSIYWGNGKDFSIKNHSYVPANGPMWIAPGDLNEDGEIDLVVANYSNGTWTEMPSFVYYGGLKDRDYQAKQGEWGFYPFKSRISLPSSNAQKPAIADFNNDGYKDIVFAFSGGFWEYRSEQGYSPSRIYWGSENGFNQEKFTNIMTKGATDVAVADFDSDDWLDLVFSNGEGDKSFIYYGSADGFSKRRLTKLSTVSPHAVESGDIDNDGSIDIVFANEKGNISFAYMNSGGKFNSNDRVEFVTHAAKDVLIEDFNKDGFADLFFTNHQFSLTGNPRLANRLIDSYLYFGGVDGFSNDNRQSLQTIGAWGANAADLNQDGWVDLLVCNFQEHYSYEVPSFIYWNGPDGFQITKRTPLYEHGAQGNAIADFNGDGNLDILITSMMGNSRGDYDPNYLYFGDKSGKYSVNNRIALPGRESYEQAFSDLDDDGQVDVLLINRGEVTRHANELLIYWNENNKFDPWRMTGLPNYEGIGVEVADLDRNGYLDIIVSNGSSFRDPEEGDPTPGSFVYWGGPEGWPISERTSLPVIRTRSASVCDINNDGHLDLVFGQQKPVWGNAAIFYGNSTREFSGDRRVQIDGTNGTSTPGVADLDKDGLLDIVYPHNKKVLIYYQQEEGFPKDKSISIPVQAKTMCIADVNSDGWLDLVCPYYKGKGKRSWYSTILLGSSKGYGLDNSIKLPTDGGTGSIVSDFNRDGYQDIFFFCHRKDGSYDEIGNYGDHYTNSRLYWGGPGGFDPESYLKIPSVGVHYDVGVDLGHIRNRGFIFEYVSSPYSTGDKRASSISWQAETPHYTSIKFQLRWADSKEELVESPWQGAKWEDSYFTNPNEQIKNIHAKKWIQYKAIFDTDNGAYSPILDMVEIAFE